MTPDEFHALRHSVGWSNRDVARMIGGDERLVRRWGSGDAAIPGPLATWLRTICPALAVLREAERHVLQRSPVPAWRTRAT